MAVEVFTKWLDSQVAATRTKLEDARKIMIEAERDLYCYSMVYEKLFMELMPKNDIENEEHKEKIGGTHIVEAEIIGQERTPAQMLATKYKDGTVVKAVETYLSTVGSEGTNVEDIELEVFDLQDTDTEAERKKVRTNLNSLLAAGVAKNRFVRGDGKGVWAIYPKSETDAPLIVDSTGASPDEVVVAEVFNEEFIEEEVLIPTPF